MARLRILLRFLILWSLVFGPGTFLRAQLGKDLPPGTESDAVIRAYGWPKGKATSGEREIWTYANFQVVLENGKVVSVAPISGMPVAGAAPLPPPKTYAKPPAAPVTPPVETPPAVVAPKAKASPAPTPTPAKPVRKLFSRRHANPDEPEGPSPLWGWLRILIGMVVVIGIGQGTALAIKHRARLKEMLRRE